MCTLLAKVKKVVNLVKHTFVVVGIYNTFEDGSDHFAKNLG